ncbi:MAG: 50S ribosomal protein L21 [Hyphomicrobiaceae bacterium]|nr:50S ribosomal protein L21 [Hyphomicrobiaceae bacterium]
MFAVIRTGGKQYRVAAEDVIRVEKLDAGVNDSVTFADVLMIGGEDGLTVGAPLIEGASVIGEVLDQARSRKVIIFKKRRRQNSRRKNGHRQHYTEVKITEILAAGAKPSTKKAAKKADEAPKAEEAVAETAAVTPLFTAPEGAADDLKKISGVGKVLEGKLNALGITTYAQIAAFTADDIARVDDVLNFKGRIDRENWVEQATTLMNEANG